MRSGSTSVVAGILFYGGIFHHTLDLCLTTPRRLREARVTGVTCASSTLPLLVAHGRKRTGFGLLRGPKAAETALGRGGIGLTRRAVASRSPVGGLGCGSGGGVDGSGYDIVLLDECSQMVEPTSLLPLAVARPRRLVLVGDPMQLPPAVSHARVSQNFSP